MRLRSPLVASPFLRALLRQPWCRALLGLALATPSAGLAITFTSEPTLEPNPNPRAPLAAVLRYSSREPLATTVRLSHGSSTTELHFDPSPGAETVLPIVGLRAGQRHRVEVNFRGPGDSGVVSRSFEFSAPPLPGEPGEFPPIHVSAPLREQMEPGVTVISTRRQVPGQLTDPSSVRFGMLLALDSEGQPIWYYRSDARISDFERTRKGTILVCTLDYEILEIDLLGNTLRRYYAAGRPKGKGDGIAVETMTFHHEVDELPNGDIAVLGTSLREIDNYYTSETEPNAPRKRQKVMGDQVIVFDREGRVVWKWDAFDHMDPFRIGYETFSGYWERRGFPGVVDWSHANNLRYDEKDDSFLVSFRYQSAILKIDRSTGNVRWVLGRPEGWKPPMEAKLFALAPGGRWFHHQHAPFPTENGSLIVFDNGNYRTMPFDPPLPPSATYSRAVEYRLDEKSRSAEEVWVSETGPGKESVVSVAMGNAEQMPQTKNVLVSYGALLRRGALPPAWNSGAGNWTRVREYTHETPAKLVWEVVIENRDSRRPMGWQAFTSTRWPSLLPEQASQKKAVAR